MERTSINLSAIRLHDRCRFAFFHKIISITGRRNSTCFNFVGNIMKPGLYKDLANEKYHASAGISNSGMRLILDCPARYHYQYLSGLYEKKQTPALIIGSLVHVLITEPKTFNSKYVVMPKCDRRTKEGKASFAAFQSLAVGKTIIENDVFIKAMDMANALNKSEHIKLLKDGFLEHSIFWEHDGVLLKTRPDFYCREKRLIVDLKTTDSVDPKDFIHSVWKYGYHSQAAMMVDGLKTQGIEIDTFILLAIEKEPPHLIQPYRILPQTIERGRDEYYRGMFIYKDCLEWDIWPAYSDKILDLNFPDYLLTRDLP